MKAASQLSDLRLQLRATEERRKAPQGQVQLKMSERRHPLLETDTFAPRRLLLLMLLPIVLLKSQVKTTNTSGCSLNSGGVSAPSQSEVSEPQQNQVYVCVPEPASEPGLSPSKPGHSNQENLMLLVDPPLDKPIVVNVPTSSISPVSHSAGLDNSLAPFYMSHHNQEEFRHQFRARGGATGPRQEPIRKQELQQSVQ